MDFARKQLEKYGWSAGKGLGKQEDGISEALKPKLKRSVAGLGHDAAADFTEHWWSELYNKAASNLEVQEKNGKTKKIKPKEDFEITNNTWKLTRKQKDGNEQAQYGDFFVKKAILDSGGVKTENISNAESDDEETVKKDVFKLTDEELFAACEGRTAHKGARHGLRALGKLARIEEQEKILLNEARFDGYSHKKKLKNKNVSSVNDLQVVEDLNLNSDGDGKVKSKKKKKKRKCMSGELVNLDCQNIDNPEMSQDNLILDSETVEMAESEEKRPKKSKNKRKVLEGNEEHSEYDKSSTKVESIPKKKNKRNTTDDQESHKGSEDNENIEMAESEENRPKKSKKKRKVLDGTEQQSESLEISTKIGSVSNKKNKRSIADDQE